MSSKPPSPKVVLANLRSRLVEVADPARAPEMQRYMKPTIPYHGVPAPMMRKLAKEVFKPLTFETQEEWIAMLQHIWDKAKFREERYAS